MPPRPLPSALSGLSSDDFAAFQRLADRLPLHRVLRLLSGADYWHTAPVPELGLPGLHLTDGPHGVRQQLGTQTVSDLENSAPATCYPTAAGLANSWNPPLLRELGAALGREARSLGVHVLLGPGLNIKRSPLCGRNFEYYSEDPLLGGTLAAAQVQGMQAQGVAGCLKHYAANNQEYLRMAVDAAVDERALREIYLSGFETAVKEAQPWTVMAAYNGVNGRYACESPRLLTQILRREWGFGGLVMSDWGAVSDRPAAFRAGLDLEMPGVTALTAPAVQLALDSGELQEADVRRAAARTLQLAARTLPAAAEPGTFCPGEAHALAHRIATQTAVLLKNSGDLLPLPADTRLAVIGAMAAKPRFQGAGSSQLVPTRVDVPLLALQRTFGPDAVSYAPGYARYQDTTTPALLQEAQATAAAAEVAVVFVGLPEAFEVEGVDREHINLPESHLRLLDAVLEVQPRTVVVLQGGSPVALPFAQRAPAILHAYLGGQAGGAALADLLSGAANPCGKLAETYAPALEDWPSSAYFPGGPRTVEYRESLLVGYRYFDRVDAPVTFPFGFGLSYTTFRLGEVTPSADGYSVTLDVTNAGTRRGAEVVQLYLRRDQATSAVLRPGQALAAFARVELAPGETRQVRLDIPPRALMHYDAFLGTWRTEAGPWTVRLGTSSRDIHAEYTLEVSGDTLPGGLPADYREPSFPFRASAGAFAVVYGRPLPDNSPYPRGGFTVNTPLSEMQSHRLARLLYAALRRSQRREELDNQEGHVDSVTSDAALRGLPLRAMTMQPGVTANPALVQLLTDLMNHAYPRAGRSLLDALRRSLSKRRWR